MSKQIVLKAGTKGKQYELNIGIPTNVEEYLAQGYTAEAINDMLEDCLRRKLASVTRTFCNDETGELEKPQKDIETELSSFVYVPGRKSTGKTSKVKAEAKADAVNMIAQLSKTEFQKLQSLDKDAQMEIVRLPVIGDWKKALSDVSVQIELSIVDIIPYEPLFIGNFILTLN